MTSLRPEVFTPRVSRDLSHNSWQKVLDFTDILSSETNYFESQRDSHVDISLLSAREIGEAVRISGIEITDSNKFQNNILKDAFRLPYHDYFVKTYIARIGLVKIYGNQYAALNIQDDSIMASERKVMLDSLKTSTGYSSEYASPKIILGKVDNELTESVFNDDIEQLISKNNIDVRSLEAMPITVEKDIKTVLFKPRSSR